LNIKRVGEFFVLFLLSLILVGIGAGGMYLLLSGQQQTDLNRLNKRIAALEVAGKEKDSAGEAKEKEETTPDSYDGWKTYENTSIGYTLMYPPDWTYAKSGATEMDMPADYVTFNNDDKDYAFSFGLRKTGSDLLISGRTGLGVGEASDDGTVSVLGQSVQKTYFTTEGRVSVIFYSAGLAAKTTIGDNEIAAELGVPGNEDKSLEGSEQEMIADLIIASLKMK
jgi:hypothetical protein